jgi:hypothetical protein
MMLQLGLLINFDSQNSRESPLQHPLDEAKSQSADSIPF